ncbi:polyhydroxyalkanoate synthesis regulator phasin [Actinoplanes octamycinicus]|uniref:Polyhydroxyalkanoate synthesis regulator phasin n=1 Tax=Actinoplanes octamycinicus TaxID=135948 RepID=A0A7W7MAN8_9ACTN|nr:hypothetical protein [Actinoplanes octamycinicus]MBB4743284.1 polyhydroxyalkanoate synthesis regulator phasin [Actinoplanes octamycinicus]GIE61797.1 hypothetical protein Aoc01nite_71990 [Actinoplanes octamycinicus]
MQMDDATVTWETLCGAADENRLRLVAYAHQLRERIDALRAQVDELRQRIADSGDDL